MDVLDIDEAALLKSYNLSTVDPSNWEDINHDEELDEGEGGDKGDGKSSKSPNPSTSTSTQDESDPLGLLPSSKFSSIRTLPKQQRAQISLSSKSFDPKAFLSTIHPDATFADLSRGVANLQSSIEGRSEALKVLVQDNFDRFVAVKATTDGVYKEMAQNDGPLAPQSEYGTKDLKDKLSKASARADQVFMPVLENNLKTIKLRSTLSVFEKSKFFFNLPGSLAESIQNQRYDIALRDYKKGKYLMESRPGQLLSIGSAAENGGGNVKLQSQQKRIFEKVWDAVEMTMLDMQKQLVELLKESKRKVEDQEKTIDILLSLPSQAPSSQDPVSIYLESQHNHIRGLMRRAYDEGVAKVDACRAVESLTPLSEKDKARDIQSCVRQLQRGGDSARYERNLGSNTWKAIHELVRHLCETLTQSLPSFWRVAKAHGDGRFGKKSSGDNSTSRISVHSASQSLAWALESLSTFTSLLSHFFSLTDVSILMRQPLSPLPEWVPSNSSSPTAAHWMARSLTELSEAVSEIEALGIGLLNAKDGSSSKAGPNTNAPATLKNLRSLVANARFTCTEALCVLWQNDAGRFFMLEDWTINPEEEATTLYLREMASFHKSNARAAWHIAGGKSEPSGNSEDMNLAKETPPTSDYTSRIKDVFLDALYAFLDGLVHLAFSDYDPLEPNLTTSQKVIADSRVTVDVMELDTRILLTVTNIAHLNKTVVPSLIKQFQDAYKVQMGEDSKTLEEVALQLDGILFTDYIKRKGDVVTQIIRTGILESGINWQTIPKPSEVHPFIYEALLSLVQVHAQVRAVAKRLVGRSITALLEELAQVTLDAFGKIPKFGMGGMLQATLEIEFLHQSLSQYVSPKADSILKSIYDTISEKYSASSPAESEALKGELDAVKRTLVASRKATALEFLCFKRPKSEREKERERERARTERSERRTGEDELRREKSKRSARV